MSCLYCDKNGVCTANCTAPVQIHTCKSYNCQKSFLDTKARSSCFFCGSEVSREEVAAIDAEYLISCK